MRKTKCMMSLLAFVMIITAVQAQKMRSEVADFKYTRPPLHPLDKNITTCYLDLVHGTEISIEEAEYVARSFKGFTCEPLTRDLTGSAMIQNKNVLIFRVWMKPFKAGQPTLHEEAVLLSDKKNYYHTIPYSYPMRLEVLIGINTEPIYKAFDTPKDFVYTSSKEPTAALKTETMTGGTIYDGMKDNAISANVGRIQNAIQSQYAFATISVSQKVWSPKTTKKADYTDLDSAQNKALRAFKAIRPGSKGLNNYRELIQEPINLWLTILKESNLADKKSRINAEVTSSIRHNLAYAYFWMGEPDKAEEQATIAAKEFDDTSWPEEITKQIADYRERVKANNP